MSFRISIKDHSVDSIYHPGDPISGTLHFHGPIKDQHLIIVLEFLGTSDTFCEIAHDCKARDIVRLFSFRQTFFEGTCHLSADQSLSWNFEFTFPEKTATTDRDWGTGASRGDKHFETSAHQLPPSFFTRQTLWMDPRPQYEARIAYQLQACAKNSSKWRPDIKAQEELTLRRKTDPETRLEMLKKVSTYQKPFRLPRAFDGLIDPNRSTSIWTWVKGIKNPETRPDPIVDCWFAMYAKKLLNDSTELSPRLNISFCPKENSLFQIPQIKIKEVKFTIKAWEFIRAKELMWPSYRKVVFRTTKPVGTREIQDWVDVDLKLEGKERKVRSFFETPSFQSYNVDRHYFWKVKTVLEVRKKSCVVKGGIARLDFVSD